MKKHFIIFAFLLSVFLHPIPYTLYPSFAAEATPTADIKSKLDQLKAEIASKAAKIKEDISQKLQNRVYLGTISSISTLSLDLVTKDGSKKITLNEDTAFENLNPKAKALNFGGLKKDASIAALGDIDDMGSLVAKKIVLIPLSLASQKSRLWGQVTTVSSGSLVISSKDGSNLAVSVDKNTTIQQADNEIVFKDIKTQDRVIISGTPNKNGAILASLIYLIPNSSTPSPTPSNSVKSSPKQ